MDCLGESINKRTEERCITSAFGRPRSFVSCMWTETFGRKNWTRGKGKLKHKVSPKPP